MPCRANKRILVTGGAGFIGSWFIRSVLLKTAVERVINLDLLTYAASEKNLESIAGDERYEFIRGDILDSSLVEELIEKHAIDSIVHFAAESHVDRSIIDPILFYRTNVEGTIALLELVRKYPHIHFHHVSTDEVYGSIEEGQFTEESPYRPNSPYAASKAASDHFVRAYAKTYGLSTTLSHSSNNYGPCQYQEKFIPTIILGCIAQKPLPVYGKGINIRDWLYVEDHAEAIWLILEKGKKGECYNIGGNFELRNIDLLELLIQSVAKTKGEKPSRYSSLITFVEDRPGHDMRYALNCNKLKNHLGWVPKVSFKEGLEKTVEWYV